MSVSPLAQRPQAPSRSPAKARTAAAFVAGDRLSLSKPHADVVPGEKIRTGLNLIGMVLGPVVTAKQTIHMIALATSKTPWIEAVLNRIGPIARVVDESPFMSSRPFLVTTNVLSRALPVLGLGILAFDGYAAIQTLRDPHASVERKALVAGRFGFNALSTALSFIPGAGFVYAIAPGFIAMGLDFWIKHLNAEGQP